MDWQPGSLIPSKRQREHIEEIVEDRSMRLSDTLGRKVEAIPYSNHMGYNLEWLFTSLIEACTAKRKWLYHSIKNFRLEDWVVDPELRARMADSPDGRKKANFFSSVASRLGAETQVHPRSAVPGATAATAAIVKALTSVFGHDERVLEIVRETIGRDDIEARPLSADELDKLESRMKSERARRYQSGG